ncbi:HET domain protein [Penicillium malachiteum]|uniref:HET domain protein n=1 Tax=Penicillium malachiteum TaxID=1324776 RepID=UPI0025497FAA|nr:HET domain protein [Penicillium malachiteum]KAJ5721221.1 HET domain protein [Penicillium malachiteum]
MALAKIRNWMTSCSQEHASCNSLKNPILPRFVVQLRSSPSDQGNDNLNPILRITESELSEKAPYIAFSYPWGVRKQPVQLMKNNINEMKHFINYKSLPRAIKDIIRLSQKFEINYIWIDVLCIVQDDPKVKKEQIHRMKNIFENSSLTVQALNIKSVHESFLLPRNHHVHEPLKLKYNENNHIYLRDFKPQTAPTDSTGNRAWMYEEAVLPSRLLVYYRDQFTFRCGGQTQYEDGCQHESFSLSNPSDSRPLIISKSPAPPDGRLDYLADWYKNILASYMPRLLTDPHDRLPAIGGVAQKVKPYIGGRYIAGIWESDLSWGLLWESDNGKAKSVSRKMERPIERRAPSWSWASVDGSVRYEFFKREKHMTGMEEISRSISMDSIQVDDDGDILNYKILSVSARIFYAYFQIIENSRRRFLVARRTFDSAKNERSDFPTQEELNSSYARAKLDITDEECQHIWVWGLLLSHSVGLVVEPVGWREGKRVFKRLGVFNVIEKFWHSGLNEPRQGAFLV